MAGMKPKTYKEQKFDHLKGLEGISDKQIEEHLALYAGYVKQVNALNEELARAAAIKDELIAELARVQARQRDAAARVEATEDQLKRAATMYKSLEQRRPQLAFSEKKLSGVESKMAELEQTSADIDLKMKALAERAPLVDAVKADVDGVHRISARSRADLQFVIDQRDQVTTLRQQVEALLTKSGETEDKIAIIESRRTTVDAYYEIFHNHKT